MNEPIWFAIWYIVAAICWGVLFAYIQNKALKRKLGGRSLSMIGLLFPVTIPLAIIPIMVGAYQGCMNRHKD